MGHSIVNDMVVEQYVDSVIYNPKVKQNKIRKNFQVSELSASTSWEKYSYFTNMCIFTDKLLPLRQHQAIYISKSSVITASYILHLSFRWWFVTILTLRNIPATFRTGNWNVVRTSRNLLSNWKVCGNARNRTPASSP